MASCCSSSNSSAPKKKLIIAVVALVIVVIAAVCMLNLNKQKPQTPAKQDTTQSVSDTNADAAADAAKKEEAKQKAEKATEKTNSIADEQYANILKDASSYLKNNQDAAYAHYFYLTQDVNKDKIKDLILIGSDDENPAASCSAIVLLSGGDKDSLSRPKMQFKISNSENAPAQLFYGKKDDTLLYVMTENGTLHLITYALFNGDYHDVQKETRDLGAKNYGVDESKWEHIDVSAAKAV